MNVYAVIMAGGVGSRFWPRSRAKTPKQLLKIFSEDTMIQATVKRLDGLIDSDKILIITNKIQKEQIIEQLPKIPIENIIAEPFGKNTAPCVALSAVIVNKLNPDSIIVTLPADHLILDEILFKETLVKAIEFASSNNALVTIGIKPSRPETGYGYIQINDKQSSDSIYKVQTFAEKPNLSTAKRFVSSGDFFWNSGMFIWKSSEILLAFETLLPDMYEEIAKIANVIGTSEFDATLTQVYGEVKSISVDYGIMEKSPYVYMVKGDFNWNDVGSWEAVYQLSNQDENHNTKIGNIFTEKTYSSYIYNPEKFTAVIGLDNLIVIETKDSLLICNRENAQSVKDVVDYLKINNQTELL